MRRDLRLADRVLFEAALDGVLHPLDDAIIHPKQTLACVLADLLVTGLLRAILAARIRFGATDSWFAV